MSIFERYNLKIVNTDLVLGEHESDELLNNDTAEDNHHLNAFKLLSSLHKEKEHEKLGQRYIDVPNDWTKNDDKVSNTFEIENFLKTFKSILKKMTHPKIQILYYLMNKVRYKTYVNIN